MKTLWLTMSAACAAIVCAEAQSNLVITSFAGNGVLTWNAPEYGVYSVEWASSLTGTWHKTWNMANMTLPAGPHTN